MKTARHQAIPIVEPNVQFREELYNFGSELPVIIVKAEGDSARNVRFREDVRSCELTMGAASGKVYGEVTTK